MANNFILPISTQSIAGARIDWNDSIEAAVTNFYSAAEPVPSNFTIDGSTPSAVPQGVLFFSANTHALYIRDPDGDQSNPVHGQNFTRNGIGSRVEASIVAAVANIGTYENGELFGTPGANSRLYMKVGSAGNTFVDVGTPSSNTITTSMLKPSVVTSAKVDGTVAVRDSEMVLTGTISSVKDSPTSALTGQFNAQSNATGNVIIGLSANGSSNVAIKHVRGGSGIQIRNGLDSGYAPIDASVIKQNGSDLIPPGAIQMYAGSTSPNGWLFCDGSAISRTDYANLFTAIGTVYGIGDGSTTFNIPDFQARVPIGASSGSLELGTQGGTFGANGVLTSGAGGAHDHDNVSTTASQGAKDSTTIDVLQDILPAPDHTHSVTIPHSVVNYIIKT